MASPVTRSSLVRILGVIALFLFGLNFVTFAQRAWSDSHRHCDRTPTIRHHTHTSHALGHQEEIRIEVMRHHDRVVEIEMNRAMEAELARELADAERRRAAVRAARSAAQTQLFLYRNRCDRADG